MSTSHTAAEPLSRLLERFGAAGTLEGAEVVSVSLPFALASGNDPLGVLGYLASIGIAVGKLEDIMRINGVADEEELSTYRVAEGVAVTVASQGEWMLFKE